MNKIRILPVLVLVTISALGTGTCRADHGKHHWPVERALSGIYVNRQKEGAILDADGVYIEPMAFVLSTLGKAAKVNRKNKCETDYIWFIGDVRMRVYSACVFDQKNAYRTHGAYAIDVWGSHPVGNVGMTGLGLRLGDSWAKMKRIYGPHCQCGRYRGGTGAQNTHGFEYSYYATYQWGPVASLSVDADAQGRIVHMQLYGDLE